jgi:hypothetical protein
MHLTLGHGRTDLMIRRLKLWTVRVAVPVHVSVAAIAIAGWRRIKRFCHLQMFFESRECRGRKCF